VGRRATLPHIGASRKNHPFALTRYALLLALGCQQVVGAKERSLDPSLSVDAGAPSALCTNYCAQVMKSCTGEQAQYVSLPVCLADCSHLPPGEPGAQFGNSVQCRIQEATLAERTGEPAEHCSAAGPEGTDPMGAPLCGSTCESYCALILPTCDTAFSSTQACEFACKTMHDLKHYDISIQRGNSVQCRIFHVSAATQAKASHCPHAGLESTHYCVDSDGGEEVASCDIAPDADECDVCERKKCCPEFDACYGDAICETADSVLDMCLDLAKSADAGIADCHAQFIAASDRAQAFESCLQAHCSTECEIPPLIP